MHRLLFFALILSSAGLATGAGARPLPRPEAVARPDEKAVLASLKLVAILPEGNPAAALEKYDVALRALPRPTPLRGLVQLTRAQILDGLRRTDEARAAAAESIRLLPGTAEPLLIASVIDAYGENIGAAADFLLRASEADVGTANLIDDYEMNNILGRLTEAHDRARLAAVSARFLLTGWSLGRPATVSSMAINVIRARTEEGRVAEAAPFVHRIYDPDDLVPLYTERRYEPLWPAVEAWAGRRFEKLWPPYLDQSRRAWELNATLDTARAYSGALAAARHDRTAVATFLPLFDHDLDPERDDLLQFVSLYLASALARLGRWDEAYGLLDKGEHAWPMDKTASGVAFPANRGRLLYQQGRFAEAVAELDGALAGSARWGAEVNATAISSVNFYRACALEQLGRGKEDHSSSDVLTRERAVYPVRYAGWRLCADDLAGARQALLDGLRDPRTREAVIRELQPSREADFPSEMARTMHRRWLQLRTDRALVAAVGPYARILAEPANASAPPDNAAAAASRPD